MGEERKGSIGKSNIRVRRAENGWIDVIKGWVRGREKLVWREGRDGDVERDELVWSPLAARLGRPNDICHGTADGCD